MGLLRAEHRMEVICQRRRSDWYGVAVFFLAALLGCAPLKGTAQVPAHSLRDIDLPAQALETSLKQLSERQKVQVVFLTEDVRGLKAPAVKGRFTLAEAIERLVDGSGLTASFNGPDTVVIKPKQAGSTEGSRQASGQIAGSTAQAIPIEGANRSQPQKGEKIVVTGSHIAREAGEGISPVVIFDRAQIERLGVSTTGDLLRYIPGNMGSAATSSLNGNVLGASHFPNLRGLGPGSTLVLVNGRRQATSAASFNTPASPAQSNLDVIPAAAIQRVEILKDSASAIYGADAIGGVINIVLRKDYSGAELSARYSQVTSGDVPETTVSLTAGQQFSRSSFLVGGEYYKRETLWGRDRAFSANLDKTPFGGTNAFSATQSAPLLANVRSVSGSNLPGLNSPFAASANIDPRALTIADFVATQGTSNALVDNPSLRTIVFPQERKSWFGHGEYRFSTDMSGSLDFNITDARTQTEFKTAIVNARLGAANPYNPFGVDVLTTFHLLNAPRGAARTGTTDYNVSAGLDGALGPDWSWGLSGLYGRSVLTQREFGAATANIAAALLSSAPAVAFNPFFGGERNSPEVLAALNIETLSKKVISEVYGAGGAATGSIWDFGAGAVKVAAGADHRSERLRLNTVQTTAAPQTLATTRRVMAAYTELSLPLFRRAPIAELHPFEVSAAVRGENYSDFGNTVNYKVGAAWRPSRDSFLRTSFSTAFQAPSLGQLYAPDVVRAGSLFTVVDPRVGATYAVQRSVISGGFAGLQPQKAESFLASAGIGHSVGGVDWKVEAGYYNIHFKEKIQSGISPQLAIDFEAIAPQLIVRDPATNRILDIRLHPLNLNSVRTDGVDISVAASTRVGGGTLTGSLSATAVNSYELQVTPVSPVLDRGSYVGFANPFKAVAQLTYVRGPWSLTGVVNYAAPYGSDVIGPTKIGASTVVDMVATYDLADPMLLRGWLSNVRIGIGVVNLFDRPPPFYNTSAGFDSGEGDPLGRRIYARVTARF
jgi:iron complex outermembrane recepter protein